MARAGPDKHRSSGTAHGKPAWCSALEFGISRHRFGGSLTLQPRHVRALGRSLPCDSERVIQTGAAQGLRSPLLPAAVDVRQGAFV